MREINCCWCNKPLDGFIGGDISSVRTCCNTAKCIIAQNEWEKIGKRYKNER